MIDRKSLTGAMIGAISWFVGYFVARLLGEGMSGVSAYAVLVGWWLTAYVSSRFTLPITTMLPLSVAYLALFFIAAISGQSWFYRDVSALTFPALLWIGLVQAVAISSPILFDWLFRHAIRICSRDSA